MAITTAAATSRNAGESDTASTRSNDSHPRRSPSHSAPAGSNAATARPAERMKNDLNKRDGVRLQRRFLLVVGHRRRSHDGHRFPRRGEDLPAALSQAKRARQDDERREEAERGQPRVHSLSGRSVDGNPLIRRISRLMGYHTKPAMATKTPATIARNAPMADSPAPGPTYAITNTFAPQVFSGLRARRPAVEPAVSRSAAARLLRGCRRCRCRRDSGTPTRSRPDVLIRTPVRAATP